MVLGRSRRSRDYCRIEDQVGEGHPQMGVPYNYSRVVLVSGSGVPVQTALRTLILVVLT